MKNILILVLFYIITFSVFSEEVDLDKAFTVAENFILLELQLDDVELSLIETELISLSDSTETPAYFIFSINNTGFIIISGQDIINPILGYSPSNPYSIANKPPAFVHWMNQYVLAIIELLENDVSQDPDNEMRWNRLLNGLSLVQFRSMMAVDNLLNTEWNQWPYYNDLSPDESPTGCVATAMAQVINYWQHPSEGNGYHGYYHEATDADDNYYNYGWLDFDFDNTTFDFNMMPSSLNSFSSSQEVNEVATLMYACGVSVDMAYTPTGSAATTIGDGVTAETALKTYFNYNSATVNGIYREEYSDNWIEILKSELNEGRPIIYRGQGDNSGGHAFVCSGYNNLNNFWFNWGWGGSSDGFFLVDALNPDDAFTDGFNELQGAIIGIEPNIGCTDVNACNYNFEAIYDDGSCEYPFEDLISLSIEFDCWPADIGWNITDETGDVIASQNEGYYSSIYTESEIIENICLAEGCYVFTITDTYGDGLGGSQWSSCSADGSYEINLNYMLLDEISIPLNIVSGGGDFEFTMSHNFCTTIPINGCIDEMACNYNPEANEDDGSCEYASCAGCTDFNACNYDFWNPSTIDDGSCEYPDPYYDCDGNCLYDFNLDGICEVWSEDFSDNTIPNVTTEDISGYGDWIFSTDPPGGMWSENAGVIQSETPENGFMLLPADFYNSYPQNGVAEGAVGENPINATFTIGPIDLTNFETNELVLQFYSNYRICCYYSPSDANDLNVYMSTDGGLTFNDLNYIEGESYEVNLEKDTFSQIPLPNYDSNSADVYFKFEWIGTHYFWMIDDISVIEQPAYDLKMQSAWLTMENPTNIEYYSIPETQMPDEMLIGAEVYNYGYNDETNILLNGSIESTNSGASVLYAFLQSNATGYIETDYFDVSMLGVGEYQFTAEIISSGDEATPEDNTLTREFLISENVYAIDGLYDTEEWMGTGWPGGDNTSDGVRYANYFDFKENSTLSSISIILDTDQHPTSLGTFQTESGGEIIAYVCDTTGIFNPLVETLDPEFGGAIWTSDFYLVSDSDVANGMVVIDVPELDLNPDAYYIVVEFYSNGLESDVLIKDDTSVPQPWWASLVFYPNDQTWYSNPNAASIRLGLDGFEALVLNEGCVDILACNYCNDCTVDDGSCEYPENNFDCNGNCIVNIDCLGACGGNALEDNCGTCDNNPFNNCIQDCAGVWGGDSVEDNCGTCDNDSTNDCAADCAGVWGGDSVEDNCGTCDNNPFNNCMLFH